MKYVIMVVMLSFLALSSCANIYTPVKDNGIKIVLEPRSCDILGDVTIEGTVQSILGLYTWGGSTYYDLLQNAKKRYPGTDEVINVTTDTKTTLFLFFYFSHSYLIHGVAIKYK